MIFVGVDWAEAHHDVHVEDEAGQRLGVGDFLKESKALPVSTSSSELMWKFPVMS
jgi:hypothetical protein